MKTITISQKEFDGLFESLKRDLDLENLKATRDKSVDTLDLHRKFIYHIFDLKRKLEDS